jgi:GDP-L-fucose synthase
LKINQNVISAAFANGVKNLVFLGSSCIYPKFAKQPIVESELLSGSLEPTNEGYALSKIVGIKLCEFLRRQYGVRYYSLMPCNLYGPGDNYNVETGHVLPTLIRKFSEAAHSSQPHVTLWGNGTPLREFLYSEDLGEAVVKSLDIETEKLPDLMNVGSGVEVTIAELADMVKDATGYMGDVVWDHSKPNGTPRKVMDSSLFKSLVNWQPKTTIKEGISLCVNDYLKNKDTLRK